MMIADIYQSWKTTYYGPKNVSLPINPTCFSPAHFCLLMNDHHLSNVLEAFAYWRKTMEVSVHGGRGWYSFTSRQVTESARQERRIYHGDSISNRSSMPASLHLIDLERPSTCFLTSAIGHQYVAYSQYPEIYTAC